MIEQLSLPPFPEEVRYLWDAFIRLRRRTTSSGFGPGLISWSDMDSFQRLAGVRLAPWEVETIEALDLLVITASSPQGD